MPIDNKLCSLNCAYCQYGWTQIHTNDGRTNLEQFPTSDEVLLAVKRALAIHTRIDYITFSGNGEPTLHPDFPKIVQVIKNIRDQMQPDVNLTILSNSTTCSRPEIRQAFEHIDLPIMKLDAGNEIAFKRLNHGKPPVSLESVMTGLKSLKKFVIQSMFVRGKIDNSSDWEVHSWIKRLQELKPLGVQIYSLDRDTASDGLLKVEPGRLKEIVDMTETMTGLRVEVF